MVLCQQNQGEELGNADIFSQRTIEEDQTYLRAGKPNAAITAKYQLFQDPHQHLEPPERSSLPVRFHILPRVLSYILLILTNEDFLWFRLSRDIHCQLLTHYKLQATWLHSSCCCTTQHHNNIIQCTVDNYI